MFAGRVHSVNLPILLHIYIYITRIDNYLKSRKSKERKKETSNNRLKSESARVVLIFLTKSVLDGAAASSPNSNPPTLLKRSNSSTSSSSSVACSCSLLQSRPSVTPDSKSSSSGRRFPIVWASICWRDSNGSCCC